MTWNFIKVGCFALICTLDLSVAKLAWILCTTELHEITNWIQNKPILSWTLTVHPHHILGTVPLSTIVSECTSTACYILWMGARLSNTMCITIEGHVQGVPDWYYTAYFSSTIITWILCKPLFACNSNGSFLLPITMHVQVQVFTVEIKKFLSVAFCNNLQCAKKSLAWKCIHSLFKVHICNNL